MKKVLFALIIAVALIAVSCSDYNVTNDLCTVQFGRLEARDGSGFASGVLAVAENEIYWRYTAVKQDDGAKTGEKTEETSLNAGAGFTTESMSVSPGDWVFTLYGYLEQEHTNLIYKGEATATLAANSVNQIPFTVEIQDGSCGTLISNLPNTVASAEYKVSMTAEYQGSDTDKVTSNNTPGHGNGNFAKQTGTLDLDGEGSGGPVEYKQAKNEKKVKMGLWKLTYTFTDLNDKSIGNTVVVYALILNGGTTTVNIVYNESETSWAVKSVDIPTISNWGGSYSGIGEGWKTTYPTSVESD